MFKCTICNIEFKTRRSLAVHVATTEKKNFDSDLKREKFIVDILFSEHEVESMVNDYLAGKFCVDDFKQQGKDISKYLTLLGVKRTSREERQTDRHKNLYLESIQKKYGDGITNISQVAEVQAKKVETVSSKHGSYDLYLAEQRKHMKRGYCEYANDPERLQATVSEIKSTILNRYGVENVAHIPEVIIKNKRSRIAFWENKSYEERLAYTEKARSHVCHRGGYESKLERRVQECLDAEQIEYKKHVMLFKYNFDLLIDDVIIEVQGDMWHGNPTMYKPDDYIMGKLKVSDVWAKDERKRLIVESNGYKIIYIWENEIRSCKTHDALWNLIKMRIDDVR